MKQLFNTTFLIIQFCIIEIVVRVKGSSNDATIVKSYGKDATILTDFNIILRVGCGKTSSKRTKK
jgi:hypothetical protein